MKTSVIRLSAILLGLGYSLIPCPAADTQAPALQFPEAYDYSVIVAPGFKVTSGPTTNILSPARLRAVSLGNERTFVWLETSAFRRTDPEKLGYRLMEFSFASSVERKSGEIRELRGALNCQIRDNDLKQGAGALTFQLFGSALPVGVQFSAADGRFAELSPRPSPWPIEQVITTMPKDGQFPLIPNGGEVSERLEKGFGWSLQLRSGGDGKSLDLAATFTFSLGSSTTTRQVALPLDKLGNASDGKPLAPQFHAWLTGTPTSSAPLVVNNNHLCVLWFKSADRMLVMDLQRLQRALLGRLLTEVQQALTQYDFRAKDFSAATGILGQLLLAEEFTSSLAPELGDAARATILTSLSNARARLEDLVFRLPVKISENPWVVFYNIRTRKARLVPDAVTWSPSTSPNAGKALQFKVPNRDLLFLMTLAPKPGFDLPAEQAKTLQASLVEQYHYQPLSEVVIQTGLPEDFTAGLALDQDGGRKLPSIAIQLCKRDATNQLLLKLASKESEAFALRELFLSKEGKGLPLTLSLDQFFLGRGESPAGTAIKGTIRVADFRIVDARDQKIPVSVWVDNQLFNKAKAASLTITLRYPGDPIKHQISIPRDSGTGLLELPLTTRDGVTLLDLEYESATVPGRWIPAPDGAEGLVVIDQ